MSDDDLTTARAYLDNARRVLTDEQRAETNRRRAVLGSSDDTHALNRSERGCGDLWLWLGSLLIALGALSLIEPRILWGLAAVLAYVIVALPVGVLVGRGMRSGR
jgi:hypothetical protein